MKVSYQGLRGAYSHLACYSLFPDAEAVSCLRFEDALERVSEGACDYAVIPIENAVGGRVADVHRLLPETNLWICGEYFQPIAHCVLGLKGVRLDELKYVYSHEQALMQCRKFLRCHGLEGLRYVDTAGAALEVTRLGDRRYGALASEQAAREYDLEILRSGDVGDIENNVTRFLVMQRERTYPEEDGGDYVTSFIFEMKSIPAALYKCLGGFATNGVNFLRLESYVNLSGEKSEFYAEIEEHSESEASKRAFEELSHFTHDYKILGVYRRSASRLRFLG